MHLLLFQGQCLLAVKLYEKYKLDLTLANAEGKTIKLLLVEVVSKRLTEAIVKDDIKLAGELIELVRNPELVPIE